MGGLRSVRPGSMARNHQPIAPRRGISSEKDTEYEPGPHPKLATGKFMFPYGRQSGQDSTLALNQSLRSITTLKPNVFDLRLSR